MEEEYKTHRGEEEDNNENSRKRNIPTSSGMEATHSRTDSPARSETHENEDNEEYETAIFTLATFAAVFVLYIYIVYSLSSPPLILRQCSYSFDRLE
ncbi:sporozoite surface protein 2-like isoform X1 [Vespula squamosa]|uniref:Sporozoite surface protein 2-like isoform X1 n=1 Tax=Vespula squamosa TaxID=30214 RepID=A0ABD2A0Z4_VESSQ